ncbi:MAG TPA: MFS transporter [Steroidobacteraceae bacterium]|jgi:predicted MFS family arabinose efflux permease
MNGSRYQGLLVGLLCLNFGILFFDRNALNFLMPFVQPDLRLSNTQVGLLASAFSLTWAIAGIVVGNLSDRTGSRKPILIGATLVFAVCSGLSGVVGSFVALFCVRLLMGIAEGGVLPVSQALTVMEIAPQRRGLAMGFMQNFGSNLLGSTAASLILLPFAAHFGWRKAFFLAAVPGLLSALLIAWLIREPALGAAGSARAERMSFGQALAQRNILLCVLISIVMVSHLVICFAFLPLFLAQVRQLDGSTLGVLLGTLGVSAAVAGFVAPGISDFVGRKPTMIVLPLFGVILPLGALFYAGPVWSLAAIFFVGWTVIGTFPLFMATIPSETVDPRLTATALGLIMGAGEGVGGVISPALAGYAADVFGLRAPLWIMFVLPILASLLALGLQETAPGRAAARAPLRTMQTPS